MEFLMDAAGRGDVDSVQQALEISAKSIETMTAPFNMTPLHVAAANGELDVLRVMLSGEVDPSVVDDLHRTPLHLAALNDHGEVVRSFLSTQAHAVDVNARAKFGITPLHVAIMRRAASAAEILIATQAVDKTAQSDDLLTALHMAADVGHADIVMLLLTQSLGTMMDRIQRTPLHYAARGGHVGVVKLLVVEHHLDVNAADADGFTALHLAARGGHTGAVVEILKCSDHLSTINAKVQNQNVQVTLLPPTDLELEYLPRPSLADTKTETGTGFTALHLAAREGHKGVVTRLLRSANCLINTEDSEGLTALHYACLRGQAEIVKILLECRHRNVNAEAHNKSTPLHLGVKSGHIPTVIELLRQIDINCNCEDESGATALDVAEREGYANLVWLLLEHPVEVRRSPGAEHLYSKQLELAAQERHTDIVKLLFQRISDEVAFPGQEAQFSGGGQSLLHWAAKMGYKQLMSHLLMDDWGYARDVNERDALGNTPLHYASQKGHIDVVRMLLARTDVDVNAENQRKETPLHVATKEGRTEVVKELSLESTGRLRATEEDKDDKTALQLAVEHRHKDIQKMLLERSDVREYVNGLYRDRQVYVDAANAILVGAALIASVTFAAWLQPPLGYAPYIGSQQRSASQPSGTYEVYANLEQHPDLQVFWIFNTLSFFFSIATVLVGAGGVLPMREGFIKDAVEKVRRALLWTALLLAGSVIFVLGAFATAGYAVLPPIPKYRNNMIVTLIFGGLVCAIALAAFLLNLYKLLPDWWRTNIHTRLNLGWKEMRRKKTSTKK